MAYLCFRHFLQALTLSILLPVTSSWAQVDFSGKSIDWIVPFREGGGADVWADFTSPYLSSYLPGNPEIRKKIVPGGGSTRGANIYAADAKPDGLSLLSTSASTQFSFLLGDSRVRYDYANWYPLLVYPTGGVVYIQPEFGISSAAELSQLTDERLTFGSIGATSLDLVVLLGFELLEIRVRPIFGMGGRSSGRLAFERGEATIDFQTSAAYLKSVVPMVEAGEAVPLFTLGVLNEQGELQRDPEFPDLPHFGEVYKILRGRPPSGIEWDAWLALFTAGFGAQKMLVVPRSTPANIKQTYELAINKMFADPEYQKAKAEVLGSYQQASGEAAALFYRQGTHLPENQKNWIRNWLRRVYKLNI